MLAIEPVDVIVASSKEKEQHVELGLVAKLIELRRLRRRVFEAEAQISVSGTLAKYTYKAAGEAIMNKSMDCRFSYMLNLFKARNKENTLIEKLQTGLTFSENYICQYKALLLQCEREFDLMINVRLYHEIILPFFIKHGQFAAVALTRSGATKPLKKVWEAFILKRDRLILREQHKCINSQKRVDAQLKSAQQ